MAIKVILDTDIGDDIDDALALGLICGSPELELVGVTTVFGNVVARARQARTVLATAGGKFKTIPVCAGCSASMASRPPTAGQYNPEAIPSQDKSCWPEEKLAPLNAKHGVQFLIDTIMNGAGDVVPILIGAMTNLAAAMVLERGLIKKIPRIVVMASEFRGPSWEWNILCDPEAAHIVFSCGVPVTVTTFEIGKQVRLMDADIARLASVDRPMAKNLSAAIAMWRGTGTAIPSLFDPMAVATMIKPELCTWKRGKVSVELAGSTTYAVTTFKEDANGPHTVAWDAKREEAVAFFLERVMGV